MTIRFISIFIRFLVPILITQISNQEELGLYYLYVSVFTFVIFVYSFELNFYFSKKELTSNEKSQFINLIQLTAAIITVYLFLGIPTLIGTQYIFTPFEKVTLVMSLLFVGSEKVLNEYGRFFTNLGLISKVIYLDLFRSISHLLSCVFSLTLTERILTTYYFLSFFILNIIIIIVYLVSCRHKNNTISVKSTIFEIRKSIINGVITSKGVITQSFMSFIYPIIERFLLERTVGLTIVGGYVFFQTLIQSMISILFLPKISNLRKQAIYLSDSSSLNEKVSLTGLTSLTMLTLVCGLVFAVFTQILLEFVKIEFKIEIDFIFSLVAILGAASLNISYIVSPHYARPSNYLAASLNTFTLSLITILCSYLLFLTFDSDSLIPFVLAIGFILQIALRRKYLFS